MPTPKGLCAVCLFAHSLADPDSPLSHKGPMRPQNKNQPTTQLWRNALGMTARMDTPYNVSPMLPYLAIIVESRLHTDSQALNPGGMRASASTVIPFTRTLASRCAVICVSSSSFCLVVCTCVEHTRSVVDAVGPVSVAGTARGSGKSV
jgi:hypothetical protein